MTQETYLPSPPAEKTEPPQYVQDKTRPSRFIEKPTASVAIPSTTAHTKTQLTHAIFSTCTKHTGPTSTPHLDAHLSTPSASAAAHTLTTAIDSATDGLHCTRCTANEAARTLTRYIFELRQAKKGGSMSKEEKKAAKVELKGLMREVKSVVREEKGRLKRDGVRA